MVFFFRHRAGPTHTHADIHAYPANVLQKLKPPLAPAPRHHTTTKHTNVVHVAVCDSFTSTLRCSSAKIISNSWRSCNLRSRSKRRSSWSLALKRQAQRMRASVRGASIVGFALSPPPPGVPFLDSLSLFYPHTFPDPKPGLRRQASPVSSYIVRSQHIGKALQQSTPTPTHTFHKMNLRMPPGDFLPRAIGADIQQPAGPR